MPWKSKPAPPALSVTTEGGTRILASGDSPVAPKVGSLASRTAFRLPVGQAFSFDAQTGKVEVLKLSKDTDVVTTSEKLDIEGQHSFTPPAAPTIAEVKNEQRKSWMYISFFVGICAGIFGLIRDWHLVMLGGVVVAGASVVGLFVVSHPIVTYILIGGVTLALTGPYLFHIMKVKTPDQTQTKQP